MRSFVKKHELPVLTHVEALTLPVFKNIDDIVIIAYLSSDQEPLLNVFRAVARKHHEAFVFGYVDDIAIADAEGLTVPSIVSYKSTDGDKKAISGPFREEDIESFLKLAQKPT